MKRTIFIYLLLAISVLTNAQIQQGYVKTKGRLGSNGAVIKGNRLSGAMVTVKGRNAVLSGSNGTFTLAIPGNNFYLQSVQKQGYVITDPDVLSKQYACSKNPLVLVLEDKAQMETERRSIERKIRNNLYGQLQKREDEIESLKNQNKITEEKYRELLQKLNSDQDANERIIKDMSNRYAKMDFDQIDDFNRRISDCIINGRLKEADSLLKTKGDINMRMVELRQLQDRNAKDEEKLNKQKKTLEKNKELAKKQLEDLAQDCYNKFELFKMQHQNDSAAYYIEQRASLDSNNVNWLLDAHKFYNTYLTDYKKSLKYAEYALSKAQSSYPDNHSLLAVCYNSIATAYQRQDSLSKSLELFKQSLNYILSDSLVDYDKKALCFSNIGIVLSQQGKYEESLKFHQKALTIRSDSINPNPKDIADCYSDIGTSLHRQGHFQEALQAFENALNICPKDGEEMKMASCLNSLGVEHETLGNYEKALNYFSQSLVIKKEIFGNLHPYVATTINNMGIVKSKQGNDSVALVLFSEALDMRLRIFGEKHSLVADNYNNIGIVLFNQKKYSDALTAYKHSLEIYEFILGTKHPRIAACLNNIGLLYVKMGEYTNAMEYLNRGLEIRLDLFGRTNVNVASSYVNLGTVAFQMKDYSLALDHFLSAKEIYEKNLKVDHPVFITLYQNLGASYRHLGKKRKSLLYYQMILSNLPPNHNDRDYYQKIIKEINGK